MEQHGESKRGGGTLPGVLADPDVPLFFDGRDDSAERENLSNGTFNPKVMSFIRDDWIRKQMVAREAEFTEYCPTRIFVGTWNVNGKKSAESIEAWLLAGPGGVSGGESPSGERPPMADMYAIGFQEIVDLNAQNVLADGQSGSRSELWEQLILETLNNAAGATGEQYELVLQKHIVGVMLSVFVKQAHRDWVSEVKGDTAGVGLMGVMGNKGGAAVRFQFRDSSFCFICAHLAAHRGNVAGRNSDFANILDKIVFKDEVVANTGGDGARGSDLGGGAGRTSSGAGPGAGAGAGDGRGEGKDELDGILRNSRSGIGDAAGRDAGGHGGDGGLYSALDHDFVIWLGDLNYRIQEGVSLESCYDAIDRGDLRFLQEHDQLNQERAAKRVFHGFLEVGRQWQGWKGMGGYGWIRK